MGPNHHPWQTSIALTNLSLGSTLPIDVVSFKYRHLDRAPILSLKCYCDHTLHRPDGVFSTNCLRQFGHSSFTYQVEKEHSLVYDQLNNYAQTVTGYCHLN